MAFINIKMKPMNALIKIVVFILITNCNAQTNLSKDTLYFNYSSYKNNCVNNLIKDNLKLTNSNTIQFNFCGNGIFIFKNEFISDTLSIDKLKKYSFTSLEKIRVLEKKWLNKNEEELIKKYGFPYPPQNKNSIFENYVIEILKDEDSFVIYPVVWKNINIKMK